MIERTKKLRICFIGWAYSIHLQRSVRWLSDRGHEIVLITDTYSPIDGIKQYEIGLPQINNRYIRYIYKYLYYKVKLFRRLSNLFLIRKIIKNEKPDILHLHTLYFPAQLGLFIGCKPLIVQPWNGDVIWKEKRSIFHFLLVKYAFSKADLMPVHTEHLKNQCIELYSANPDKIKIITFAGVDLDIFNLHVSGDEVLSELGITQEQIVISTRNISYNVLNIVKAVPFVIKRIPGTRFIFAWPPNDPFDDTIKSMVNDLGINKYVYLIGSIPHNKIPNYLAIASVFVSISHIDCFPSSVLEAMAMGVIPVMGDIPPIRTYLTDNYNGYLVDLDDINQIAEKIVKALSLDEKTKSQFVNRNINLIKEKADFQKEMIKMENCYFELIK